MHCKRSRGNEAHRAGSVEAKKGWCVVSGGGAEDSPRGDETQPIPDIPCVRRDATLAGDFSLLGEVVSTRILLASAALVLVFVVMSVLRSRVREQLLLQRPCPPDLRAKETEMTRPGGVCEGDWPGHVGDETSLVAARKVKSSFAGRKPSSAPSVETIRPFGWQCSLAMPRRTLRPRADARGSPDSARRGDCGDLWAPRLNARLQPWRAACKRDSSWRRSTLKCPGTTSATAAACMTRPRCQVTPTRPIAFFIWDSWSCQPWLGSTSSFTCSRTGTSMSRRSWVVSCR